ncbi:polysaccharide deacetylase family protein [Clostridium sp.]|uniref:polysaccharide deacetylase family protein n=1 Tax=Clostridium sp. TaxID=1506 RepID=UPI003F2E8189
MLLVFSIIGYFNYNINEVKANEKNKTIYLTFDDGPTPCITRTICNVLNKNNVKASFFIVGNNARKNPELLKLLNDGGMCIMPHSDMHVYENIYSSSDAYFNDLHACEKTIKDIVGKSEFKFIRMPGGADNSVGDINVINDIRNGIVNSGKYYIDWSVDSGDTEYTDASIDFIESRVREYGGLYDVEVLLMHDLSGKETSIVALQWVIDFYKERGYEFKTLDNINEEEISYLKKIKVVNKCH